MTKGDAYSVKPTAQQLALPAALPQAAYPGWQITLSFGVGWAFIIVGLLGVLYTPVLIWQTHQFLVHAIHAQATIVDFKAYPPGRHQSHETYRPIVEISDATGTPAHALVGAAAFPSPYQVSGQIDVLYPPGKPGEAVMNTTEDKWGATIAAMIIFPFTLFIGILVVLWMRFFIKHPPEHLAWLDRWSLPLRLASRFIAGG